MAEDREWFSGAARTDDEQEFLDQLRRDAARWNGDVHPADTVTFAWELGPLIVGLEIPKITAAYRHLWVSYWSIEPGQGALEGARGDDLIADDYTADREESLTVAGVEAEAAQFARWCSPWLVNQRRRPVALEEWGPAGGAAVWKLADTSFELQTRGLWWRRRGPSTRVHRER